MRLALTAVVAGILSMGCGARLTPPEVPAERQSLDHLARQRASGAPLDPRDSRRLAVLLDRYDNAPERADLVDGSSADPRARQAWAWRGWARQSVGWPGRLVAAIAADPRDAGAVALAALLDRAPRAVVAEHRPALLAARGEMRPAVRCVVDGLWMRPPGPRCAAAVDDIEAALDELADRDPVVDPEAERLRWTVAHMGPAPRPVIAAEAAAAWVRRWPRHADGWTMVGATAAVDPRATPAERLAWSGAAWRRAVDLDARAVLAHLALADLEARHGLPATAERHRLDARRAVGADRALPERWARAPLRVESLADGLPARDTAAALDAARPGDAPPPPVLLDRSVVVIRAGSVPTLEVQRLSRSPLPAEAGCVESTIGRKRPLYEQTCRGWIVALDGVVEIPFPAAWAVARAEIVVRSTSGVSPRFESHGGAPGARVVEGAAGAMHVFTLDAVDPNVEGRRRPRVRVRVDGLGAVVPAPAPGMVDRLVAVAEVLPEPVPGDVRRSVARARAAGRRAEQAWLAVDGRPVTAWARLDDGRWRWFAADGTPLSVDGPIVAATRAEWVGRPSTPRAAADDLPSSGDPQHPPRAGRP